MTWRGTFWGIAGSLLLAAGCAGGSELELADLSGHVTFDDKPLHYGQIDFVPDTGQGHSGPAGTAEVFDGRYDTAEAGRGIVPGPHLVRITGYDMVPLPASADETVESDADPPIFSGYTLEADLSGGIQNFEIPESASGFNIFESRQAEPAGDAP